MLVRLIGRLTEETDNPLALNLFNDKNPASGQRFDIMNTSPNIFRGVVYNDP